MIDEIEKKLEMLHDRLFYNAGVDNETFAILCDAQRIVNFMKAKSEDSK